MASGSRPRGAAFDLDLKSETFGVMMNVVMEWQCDEELPESDVMNGWVPSEWEPAWKPKWLLLNLAELIEESQDFSIRPNPRYGEGSHRRSIITAEYKRLGATARPRALLFHARASSARPAPASLACASAALPDTGPAPLPVRRAVLCRVHRALRPRRARLRVRALLRQHAHRARRAHQHQGELSTRRATTRTFHLPSHHPHSRQVRLLHLASRRR